jgi:hypothetical protein
MDFSIERLGSYLNDVDTFLGDDSLYFYLAAGLLLFSFIRLLIYRLKRQDRYYNQEALAFFFWIGSFVLCILSCKEFIQTVDEDDTMIFRIIAFCAWWVVMQLFIFLYRRSTSAHVSQDHTGAIRFVHWGVLVAGFGWLFWLGFVGVITEGHNYYHTHH